MPARKTKATPALSSFIAEKTKKQKPQRKQVALPPHVHTMLADLHGSLGAEDATYADTIKALIEFYNATSGD